MIYVDYDPEFWSFKHDVPIITETCEKCGMQMLVNVPVISKDYVGFESEDHGCGPEYIISLLRIRKGDIF